MPQAQSGLPRPFKEDWRPGDRDSATERRMLGRILNWAHGVGNIVVRLTTSGIVVDGSRLIAYADIPFGYSIASSNVVTINGGEVQAGTRNPYIIPDRERTITADGQFLGVEFNFDTAVADITSPSTTKPVSESPYFRTWLYQFSYDAATGRAARMNIGWVGGNIMLPGTWAAVQAS